MRTVVAVLLALCALTCSWPAQAAPIFGEESFVEESTEEDYVASLNAANPDTPVQVAFGHHAAIYLLERADPSFAAWLAILQHSLQDKSRVRFAYAVEGPRLTLVESVP
jgi:hypothetical protein